jgi:hypothetical protein
MHFMNLHKLRNLIIVTLAGGSGASSSSLALVSLSKLAQLVEGVGAKLGQDTGDELSQFLLLTDAVNDEGVGGDGSGD